MSYLSCSPTLADLYAWNLFQFDAATLQKLWWLTHDMLFDNLEKIFMPEGPYRGAQVLPVILLLVRNRYPDCPSPLLDEVWREKGFSAVGKDMEALWEGYRLEARRDQEDENKKPVERDDDPRRKAALEDQIAQYGKIASVLEEKHQSDRAVALEFRTLQQQLQAQHQVASSSSASDSHSTVASKPAASVGSEWTDLEGEDHRGEGRDAAAKGEKAKLTVGDDVW